MISLMFGLLLLCVLLWLGFKLTGALLLACFWLFVELPLSLMFALLGLLCCCTLILIPLGISLFGLSFRLLIPGI